MKHLALKLLAATALVFASAAGAHGPGATASEQVETDFNRPIPNLPASRWSPSR